MKNIFGLCLVGLLLNGCAGSADENASMVRLAQKARHSGNSEAAISFYNKALAMDPDNTEAILGLAETYIDLKLLDAAIGCIKKAENKGCDVSKSSHLRGKICLLSGDNLSAEKEFLKSTSTDSMNALGTVYDHRGEHDRAQRLYRQIISENPNYIDAYNNMGLSLMLCDKYKEAISYLENACSLPEASSTYRSNLALAYGLYGNVEKAKSIYAQDFEGDELAEKIAYIEDIILAKQRHEKNKSRVR